MSYRAVTTVMICSSMGLVLAACPAERGGEQEAGADTMPVVQQVPAPDTTAAGLWAHLQGSNYRESWATWPGKGELYEGQEPHGMLLTTYLNSLALDAVTNMAGSMPPGAVVVKENFAPDSTYAAATIMYKAAAGYDTTNNNWFWLKRTADGTIEAQGRVAGCIGCHGQQRANDFIFTGALR